MKLDKARQAEDLRTGALLPCPFCGCDAEGPENVARKRTCSPTWQIGCSQFCCSIRSDLKRKVVEAWNRRAPTLTAAPDTGDIQWRILWIRQARINNADSTDDKWLRELADIVEKLIATPLPDTSAAPQGAGNGGDVAHAGWLKFLENELKVAARIFRASGQPEKAAGVDYARKAVLKDAAAKSL